MRDPERIPMILAAVEREWRKNPDLRLGQLLVVVTKVQGPNPLFNVEDGQLLAALGPQTEEERRYVAEEPRARRRGMAEWWAHWRGERNLDKFFTDRTAYPPRRERDE